MSGCLGHEQGRETWLRNRQLHLPSMIAATKLPKCLPTRTASKARTRVPGVHSCKQALPLVGQCISFAVLGAGALRPPGPWLVERLSHSAVENVVAAQCPCRCPEKKENPSKTWDLGVATVYRRWSRLTFRITLMLDNVRPPEQVEKGPTPRRLELKLELKSQPNFGEP
jgi:hypothetical protein